MVSVRAKAGLMGLWKTRSPEAKAWPRDPPIGHWLVTEVIEKLPQG
jgi:hypothetical protein